MKSKLIYSLMLLAGLNLMGLASAQTPAPVSYTHLTLPTIYSV